MINWAHVKNMIYTTSAAMTTSAPSHISNHVVNFIVGPTWAYIMGGNRIYFKRFRLSQSGPTMECPESFPPSWKHCVASYVRNKFATHTCRLFNASHLLPPQCENQNPTNIQSPSFFSHHLLTSLSVSIRFPQNLGFLFLSLHFHPSLLRLNVWNSFQGRIRFQSDSTTEDVQRHSICPHRIRFCFRSPGLIFPP